MGNNGPLKKRSASENQDKSMDVYIGVFFDALDISVLANFLRDEEISTKGEYIREAEEAVQDVKDSRAYQIADQVLIAVKAINKALPDNDVSNAILKTIDLKEKGEKLVDDGFGKVTEIDNAISDPKSLIPNSVPAGIANEATETKDVTFENLAHSANDFGLGSTGTDAVEYASSKVSDLGKEIAKETPKLIEEAEENLIGSRSIISKLEPKYIGESTQEGLFEDDLKDTLIPVKVHNVFRYCYRIYTTGAVTNQELKGNNDDGMDDATRKILINQAFHKAVYQIKCAIRRTPPKQSVHFEVFGYKKDPAVQNFISKIDQFNQEPNVNESSLDYQGLYENLCSPEEVKNDMKDTTNHFTNLDKL